MAEFVLDVHDISEAGKHYDFAVPVEWLARALEGTDVRADARAEPGRLTLDAHRQGADIVVVGRVSSTLITDCARCLGDAVYAVEAELVRLLTAVGDDYRPEPDELELTPEDLDREFYRGDRIVLDDSVRDNLLLEIPIQPLCSESCEGIPIPESVSGPREGEGAGASRGIDPRLAPLMSLVGRVPTEE